MFAHALTHACYNHQPHCIDDDDCAGGDGKWPRRVIHYFLPTLHYSHTCILLKDASHSSPTRYFSDEDDVELIHFWLGWPESATPKPKKDVLATVSPGVGTANSHSDHTNTQLARTGLVYRAE